MREAAKRSRIVVAAAAFALLAGMALPSHAEEEVEFPLYTGGQLNELFTTAPLDHLAPPGPAPAITGESSVDARIRQIAEERGYLRRPFATELVAVDGHRLQEEAASAWQALQAEASRAGYTLQLLAGYRTASTQRAIFLGGLVDYSDSEIDAQLRWAAPPGYSKHHTGYAVDITQAGWRASDFDESPAGRWLAVGDYRNAKRFGFIPSYPEDAIEQGPEPEPWEWTYVGVDTIRCGSFHLGYAAGLDSANPAGTIHDLEVCGDLALTRGAVAYYLSDVLGVEEGSDDFVDDDGTVYEDAIEGIAAAGITAGCNPPEGDRFCPKEHVTRGEMAVFLDRALDWETTDMNHFTDDDGSPFEDAIDRMAAAGITQGCNPPAGDRFCPQDQVTRRQLLAFLDRALDLPEGPTDYEGTFVDDDGSVFEGDIEWLAASGISRGCNPPVNDRFCPDRSVSRGEMAAFLVRAFGLTEGTAVFVDTRDSVFDGEIAALAEAGITAGCNPPRNDRFCPQQAVTRAQMAAFLTRALGLDPSGRSFIDTSGHVFESDIAALAGAGITRGCNPPSNDRFCPGDEVTRAQMAAFLHRALD